MELQKQPKTATKEQMRLAELLIQERGAPNSNDDIASQKRVKKVVELTNCTASAAEVALIDCEGSVEAAVALLLDKPGDLVLWSQQGKTRKSKSTTLTSNASDKPFGSHGRRGESQRGNRFRHDGAETQGRPKRGLLNKDQNGHSDRAKSHEHFAKNQNRSRFAGKMNGDSGKNDASTTETKNEEWGINGWGDSNIETEAIGTFSSTANRTDDKDNEWKNGPRVFMPSSLNANVNVSSSAVANVTSSWPSLDTNPTSNTNLTQQTVHKPKTFASVAATKKMPPPAPPQPMKSQAPPSDEPTQLAKSSKDNEGGVTEWSSSVDWRTSLSPLPAAEPSQTKQGEPPIVAQELFGSSGHSLSVNQEYTDHLKSAIGLMQNNPISQNQAQSSNSVIDSTGNYFQQQISQLQQSIVEDISDLNKKVEFATGDMPPPVTNTTGYQFGFQFNIKEGIPSAASLNDAWTTKPSHISSVELDRSMLKNANANVLSTMTNIPTTSSNVTAHAHFTTSAQQQLQSHEYQRNTSHGAALSFTDTASVNYPPANSTSAVSGAPASLPPPSNVSSTNQQQQIGKPLYTAANPSMVAAAPQQQQLQHLQHQSQAIYHQTSAAAPTAVAQFPNYNIPYMYSPVAPAPTLPGTNADIDRFIMQQYGAYGGLDVQLGAMSLGPATTLAPSHRNPLESFMDNKFGPPQQQQSVNQGNNSAIQHNQSNQQHRGPGQPETNAMFGGGGHVAPPPGFGMPAATAQASYITQPPTNLQSLFQMPTYHHPPISYQHQFMMPNANRIPASQRPAQNSPPEGNGHQQRRHDTRGPDSQGYGPDSAEHSTGGNVQSYTKFNNYRPYM